MRVLSFARRAFTLVLPFGISSENGIEALNCNEIVET